MKTKQCIICKEIKICGKIRTQGGDKNICENCFHDVTEKDHDCHKSPESGCICQELE